MTYAHIEYIAQISSSCGTGEERGLSQQWYHIPTTILPSPFPLTSIPAPFKNQWIALLQFICSAAEHTEQAVSTGLKVGLLRCACYNVLSFVNSS